MLVCFYRLNLVIVSLISIILSSPIRADLAGRQDDECTGQLCGDVGFVVDERGVPQFRPVPNVLLVLQSGSKRIRIEVGEDGDYYCAGPYECGEYRLVEVVTADGAQLVLAKDQPKTIRIDGSGDQTFDVLLDRASTEKKVKLTADGDAPLRADCAPYDSSIEMKMSVANSKRRQPIAKREYRLVIKNVSSRTIRLDMRRIDPVRIYDQWGKEVPSLPDSPHGPPRDPEDGDMITLAPGETYETSDEVGWITEDALKSPPYYVRAFYYGGSTSFPSGLKSDDVKSCSNILVLK